MPKMHQNYSSKLMIFSAYFKVVDTIGYKFSRALHKLITNTPPPTLKIVSTAMLYEYVAWALSL